MTTDLSSKCHYGGEGGLVGGEAGVFDKGGGEGGERTLYPSLTS